MKMFVQIVWTLYCLDDVELRAEVWSFIYFIYVVAKRFPSLENFSQRHSYFALSVHTLH